MQNLVIRKDLSQIVSNWIGKGNQNAEKESNQTKQEETHDSSLDIQRGKLGIGAKPLPKVESELEKNLHYNLKRDKRKREQVAQDEKGFHQEENEDSDEDSKTSAIVNKNKPKDTVEIQSVKKKKKKKKNKKTSENTTNTPQEAPSTTDPVPSKDPVPQQNLIENMETLKPTITTPSVADQANSKEEPGTQQDRTRKRTKTRSRQKNIKKDHRPEHLKPKHLTQWYQ